MKTKRAEWSRRVGQWRRSGLTATEFGRRSGVNAGTLSHWAWRLGRERREEAPGARRTVGLEAPAALLEIVGAEIRDGAFQIELGNGRRVRVPASFNAQALERLLGVLEPSR